MRYPTKILILFYSLLSNAFFMHEDFPRLRIGEKKKLKNEMKVYMIDIDGTICETENSNYYNSIPINENIHVFNKLYDSGNEVHYWTARGAKSGLKWDEYTVHQLEKWGVKYTSIKTGKPHYDVWIDDKAINVDDINHPKTWLRW